MSTSAARTVTITRAKRELMLAMKKKRPVFPWGPPGIGKSELVEQIAEDFDGYMIDLRMALMEPTDLRGIPFFDSVSGTRTKRVYCAPFAGFNTLSCSFFDGGSDRSICLWRSR